MPIDHPTTAYILATRLIRARRAAAARSARLHDLHGRPATLAILGRFRQAVRRRT